MYGIQVDAQVSHICFSLEGCDQKDQSDSICTQTNDLSSIRHRHPLPQTHLKPKNAKQHTAGWG